jgi:hypothetical protein
MKYLFLFVCLLNLNLQAITAPNNKAKALEVCKTLKTVEYKKTCFRVVNRASFYEINLLNYCSGFQYNWYKIYCLDRGRNSTFETGTLEACKTLETPSNPARTDSDKLDCMVDAAKTKSFWANSNTAPINARGYNSYLDAYLAVEKRAQTACLGWDHYVFVDVNWKTRCGWNSIDGVYCSDVQIYCKRMAKANEKTIEYSGGILE